MYAEGLMDLMEMIMTLPFIPDVKEKLENIENKAKTRYLPVFEKVSVLLFRFLTNQTDPNWGCIKMYCNLIAHLLNLPGSEWNRVPGGRENKHGWCAAAWMHPDAGGEVLWDFCILSQHKGDFLIYFFYPHMLLTQPNSATFPTVPQSFQGRMTRKDAIQNFLNPDSKKRKPQPDDNYVQTVMKVFNITKLP